MGNLQGKVAVITGGNGFGEAPGADALVRCGFGAAQHQRMMQILFDPQRINHRFTQGGPLRSIARR